MEGWFWPTVIAENVSTDTPSRITILSAEYLMCLSDIKDYPGKVNHARFKDHYVQIRQSDKLVFQYR